MLDIERRGKLIFKHLTEAQAKENDKICEIITEETGINMEVSNLTRIICDKVKSNENGTQSYPLTIAGTKYQIRFYFEDYEKKSEVPEEKTDYTGITYFQVPIINIFGYRVKKRVQVPKLMEVVSHELLHAFNLQMSKKDGFINNKKEVDIYQKSVQNARDKKLSKEEADVAYAIYLSYKFESNAFENGLYNFLMASDDVLVFPGDEMSLLTETMYYKRFTKVKNAYTFVKSNIDAAGKIAETYGKDYDWLAKTVEFALKNTRRQIGRALAKFKKDYDWTQGGKISITV